MFNVFAVALIYGVPVLREIPLKLAEKLAEIGTNNKSAALGYILGSFFVVPGLIVLAVR
jgi:sodium-dependent phosphate cotransporter